MESGREEEHHEKILRPGETAALGGASRGICVCAAAAFYLWNLIVWDIAEKTEKCYGDSHALKSYTCVSPHFWAAISIQISAATHAPNNSFSLSFPPNNPSAFLLEGASTKTCSPSFKKTSGPFIKPGCCCSFDPGSLLQPAARERKGGRARCQSGRGEEDPPNSSAL